MNQRPNLFLIGAMKSGTTTLHELLAPHPQIVMSEPKEPCYFVDPEQLRTHWPEMWRRGFWKSQADYLALFPERQGALYYGESSTDYAKAPRLSGVPQRMAAFNPDARILFVMRDPVERTISHYWHMVELRGEKRQPLEAIQAEPHYTEVSHYAYQLRPFLDLFGRERVHVLTFEALTAEPAATVSTLCRWLGLDERFEPCLGHAANVTPATVHQKRVGSGLLDRFRHSAMWDAMGEHCPPALRRLGVRLIEREVVPKQTDTSTVRKHLRALQRPQTQELAKLLGRDFPEWKTLYGD